MLADNGRCNRLTSAASAIIDYHRLSISKHGWHLCFTQCSVARRQQSQHRLPNSIGCRRQHQNQTVSSSASIGHRVSQAQDPPTLSDNPQYPSQNILAKTPRTHSPTDFQLLTSMNSEHQSFSANISKNKLLKQLGPTCLKKPTF